MAGMGGRGGRVEAVRTKLTGAALMTGVSRHQSRLSSSALGRHADWYCAFPFFYSFSFIHRNGRKTLSHPYADDQQVSQPLCVCVCVCAESERVGRVF